jgi:hypothetical protein
MSHGIWCNGKAFPTTCKCCGKRIFYYSCDCGSKVFFDRLGGSWPIHECTKVKKIVKPVYKPEAILIKKSSQVSSLVLR